MDLLGGIKLFFSLLLLIQLFARSELHPASAENHVCHRMRNTRKALEGVARVQPIDSAITHSTCEWLATLPSFPKSPFPERGVRSPIRALLPRNLGGSTHLQGANLKGANLEGAKLEGAEYDAETVLPDGFDPKTHKMIFKE
jgi:hypothetical protein